ncbi:MAG TPA: cyanophycin synthetase [Gemmatimonadales bacterium]|nr:cyanophycin synthetase [Gemmatimonadales bacterium]
MTQPILTTDVPSIDPAQLEITRLRALRGPNYWRLAPVVVCDVRLGNLENITTADAPRFSERLLEALPSLQEHPCSRNKPGGFVERLYEGTGWIHVLEHVALELQTLAGTDVDFGRAVQSGDEGVWWLIVEYEEEELGTESVRQAVELVRACLAGVPVDIDGVLRNLRELLEDVRLGPSTGVIVEEARRRGIPFRRLGTGSLVQLGMGRNLRRIQATTCDTTSIIAADIAQNKDLTKRMLQGIGLAVPQGAVVHDADEAVERAREIGFPVILKPVSGNQGRGISPRLDDEAAVRAAWSRTSTRYPDMVVERHAAGRDHRVLVVNGKVVAVAERVAAHVVGDGSRTISQLIEEANRDPRRGRGHGNVLTLIPADDATLDFLAQCGLTLDSIPVAGERVFLRSTANLSTGGTSIDRTDEIHPDNITASEMAAAVVGLDIAGLDVLTPDISRPFHENGAVIIEVNAGPGIRMHTHPAEGKPRNVAGAILDMLYPAGARSTIPIIAVTGTNGKTTTTRLIAHLFRASGRTVGYTTTDGVYLQNRMVVQGDMTGPFAANVVLSNPTVDVAVLETARGGLLRSGLGFEECDVGIVLNVSADHLGLGGITTVEQLADVKSVIPAVVRRRGYAVLNADDPLVLGMSEKTRGDVVLFSVQEGRSNPHVERHVDEGGTAATMEQGTFVIRRGRLCIPIAAANDVPLTLGGAARFQYGNILAAVAAAYVQGMRYEDIRSGLLSFFPSPALTPGRLNLLRVGQGQVLVDYAHNPAAVEGLIDLVRRMPARRRIGVVTAPGDRRDEDLREVGRRCAGLDYVILKEDDNLRGRRPGEIVGVIAQGLADAGISGDQVETVYTEAEAVARALDQMGERDLVVVLADDVPAVLEQLLPLRVVL